MSIRKMIALHPDVQGHVNQPLGDAVHHAMYCAKMCLSCADACSAEDMDMVQCIRTCLDCAAVCDTAATLGLRRAGSNEAVLRKCLSCALEPVTPARPSATAMITSIASCALRFAANAPVIAAKRRCRSRQAAKPPFSPAPCASWRAS